MQKKILPRLAVMQGPAKAHRGRVVEKILPRLAVMQARKILPRLAVMQGPAKAHRGRVVNVHGRQLAFRSAQDRPIHRPRSVDRDRAPADRPLSTHRDAAAPGRAAARDRVTRSAVPRRYGPCPHRAP